MTSDTTPHGCSKIVDLLVDYLEGRLSPDTRDEISYRPLRGRYDEGPSKGPWI